MSAKNLYWSLLLLALAFALPSAALAVPPPDTATVTPTETATMTPSPSPTLTAVCGSTFGCSACSTAYGSAPYVDWFYASQFNLPSSGTLNLIYTYHSTATGGKVRAGIYADQAGKPGALLAVSIETVAVNGWTELAVNPTYLNAGNYWIGALVENHIGVRDLSSSDHRFSIAYPYGALPATAPTGSTGTGSYVFYASYCPGPPLFFTPTPTATPTQTPIQFASAGAIGKTVLGPVPAHKGNPICLYYSKTPKSSTWEVYNLTGQLVSSLSFGLGEAGCWATDNVAPGIYVVRAQIGYVDGSAETVTQKVVVLP